MSLDAKNITQGGQVIKYMIGMFLQITHVVGRWAAVFGITAFFAYLFLSMKFVYIKHGLFYFYVKYVVTGLGGALASANNTKLHQTYTFNWTFDDGRTVSITKSYAQVLSEPYFIQCFELLKKNAFYAYGFGLAIFITVLFAAFIYLGRAGKNQRKNEKLSGRYLASSVEEVNKLLKKRGVASHLKIGNLHLVKDSEIQNIALHGTVGTGKSTIINSLLSQVREANQRAIIYDKGNNFVPLFYREGKDIILNPLDLRCPKWSLWDECVDRADLENFAQPLLPESKSSDPFWVLSARNLFVATAEKMRHDKDRSIEKLLNNLLSISLEDLYEYLKDTDASNLVSSSIEKTALTIRSVLAAYAKALRLCQAFDNDNNQRFSIREWIKNADEDAWIFIASDGRLHESLKPLITTWLNITMQGVLGLTPDLKRRVWTILDELNSLHKLPLIIEYLSEARKFGGVSLLGVQNFPQLANNYGNEGAKSIWDLVNTVAYFRAPSGDVAKWVEKEIGEIRHLKFRDQYSYGVDDIRDGVNFSKDDTTESIVNYSDIQSLNDLECYVTLKGDYPVVKVKLERKSFKVIAEAKIERDLSTVTKKTDEKIENILASKTDSFIESILSKNTRKSESSGHSNNMQFNVIEQHKDNITNLNYQESQTSQSDNIDKYNDTSINIRKNRNFGLDEV